MEIGLYTLNLYCALDLQLNRIPVCDLSVAIYDGFARRKNTVLWCLQLFQLQLLDSVSELRDCKVTAAKNRKQNRSISRRMVYTHIFRKFCCIFSLSVGAFGGREPQFIEPPVPLVATPLLKIQDTT